MQNSLMLSTRYWYGVALLANDVEGVRVVRRHQGRGGDLRKLQAEELPARPQHTAGLPQRYTHIRDVKQVLLHRPNAIVYMSNVQSASGRCSALPSANASAAAPPSRCAVLHGVKALSHCRPQRPVPVRGSRQ